MARYYFTRTSGLLHITIFIIISVYASETNENFLTEKAIHYKFNIRCKVKVGFYDTERPHERQP